MTNWKASIGCFLIGIVSLAVGFAMYYGELALIKASPIYIPADLPLRFGAPGWIIGAIFVALGIVFLF